MPQSYTIVDLEQGSEQWLDWRHQGIGASDAPVIMGENPWRGIDQLLAEKMHPRRDGFQNEAMRRGTELEPTARSLYCTTVGVTVRPACLQSLRHDWLRASVDGISVDGQRVVEIKCGQSVYRKTATSGSPPDYYFGQLQHVLALTGLATIDFWCFFPALDPIHVVVNRNEGYIRRLLLAEEAFWDKILKHV